MTVPDVLFIIGLAAAAIEELEAKGRSVGWWGVFAVCVGLLWGSIIK